MLLQNEAALVLTLLCRHNVLHGGGRRQIKPLGPVRKQASVEVKLDARALAVKITYGIELNPK